MIFIYIALNNYANILDFKKPNMFFISKDFISVKLMFHKFDDKL